MKGRSHWASRTKTECAWENDSKKKNWWKSSNRSRNGWFYSFFIRLAKNCHQSHTLTHTVKFNKKIPHQHSMVWSLLNISKSNYIHNFECVRRLFLLFYYLTIFGWNLSKTKTIFIRKLLRICLSMVCFCFFCAFLGKEIYKEEESAYTHTFDAKKGAIGLHKFYHTFFSRLFLRIFMNAEFAINMTRSDVMWCDCEIYKKMVGHI